MPKSLQSLPVHAYATVVDGFPLSEQLATEVAELNAEATQLASQADESERLRRAFLSSELTAFESPEEVADKATAIRQSEFAFLLNAFVVVAAIKADHF